MWNWPWVSEMETCAWHSHEHHNNNAITHSIVKIIQLDRIRGSKTVNRYQLYVLRCTHSVSCNKVMQTYIAASTNVWNTFDLFTINHHAFSNTKLQEVSVFWYRIHIGTGCFTFSFEIKMKNDSIESTRTLRLLLFNHFQRHGLLKTR